MRRWEKGFITMPVVTGVALALSLSLLMLFRAGLMQRDQASKNQLRADYHQREEAFLRALVTVFPKKAIACMEAGYASSDLHSWNSVFTESVALASTHESLSTEVTEALGLESMRSADVGNSSAGAAATWVTSLSGTAGRVTPGTTAYSDIFNQPQFAGKVPPLLNMSSALQEADALRPVVSSLKQYSTQAPGLLASVVKHPVYNLIPYPNIRFGYAEPGQPFVAKRNWWAFKVTFGGGGGGTGSVPAISKCYVLSLYEIPSQLPIEGAAFAEIGRHGDGAAWNSSTISIDGGVYADKVTMSGSYGMERVMGKESVKMDAPMTLDGSEVSDDFDSPGVREQLQADRRSDILPVAISANSGRLSFVPIERSSQFLQRTIGGGPISTWDAYTKGGEQCRMTVEAISMVSLDDQTPTAIRIRFQKSTGGWQEVILRRGQNWPTLFEATGDSIPFQTELTDTNRACLTIYPGLLNAWLGTKGGAPVSVNNSIHIQTDAAQDPLTVMPITDPPSADSMAVIIRKGKDLTSFTKGLSIVAPTRVYVGDDLNATATAVPEGSGLPAGSEYYPPMSISAAELRIGTTFFNRPFEHHGQILSLASGGAVAWQPLDVRSGSDDAVHTDTIAAELKPLKSPAELPPVHQMNWLVVIEEIPRE